MSDPMSLTLPTPGGSSGVWGTLINAAFGLVSSHDHTSGKGVQVPTAGLNVNADLAFNTFGAIALKLAGFVPVAPSSVTSYANALFVSSADSNLWWRNAAGTDVMLTDGDTLNVAGFVGGIGGDYSAVSALLSYDDATHRYLFQQEGSPRPWAGAAMGNLDIYEEAASIANHITIKSPSALAASYAMTLPTALPAGPRPVYLDDTGAITNSAGMSRIGRQLFTNSGTYTPTTGVRAVLLRMVGGGGGGGGTTEGVNDCAGSGGASGFYLEKWISGATALTGGAIAIGGGGTAGYTSTAPTAGGDTTAVVAGTTYTARGGGAGANQDSTATPAQGGAIPSGSSYASADFYAGADGGPSIVTCSGAGGGNPLGSGGGAIYRPTNGGSDGKAGLGYGGGGGGGASSNNSGASAHGGVGLSGLVIIDEYM